MKSCVYHAVACECVPKNLIVCFSRYLVFMDAISHPAKKKTLVVLKPLLLLSIMQHLLFDWKHPTIAEDILT